MQTRTAALMAGILIIASSVSAQGVAWRTDLAAAQQEAAKSGKLVLLHFWSTSCGPCIALDKTVFNQQTVAGGIERIYVPVKLTEDECRQIAATYGVTRIPTDVILTSDGKVVQKLVSPSSPMEYVSTLTQVASSYATKAGSAYNAAVANAPVASTLPGQKVLNNAYAGLGLPANAPLAAAAPPSTPSAGSMMDNRYATAPIAPAGQPPIAQQPVAQQPVAQQPVATAQPAVPPMRVENPYAQQQPPQNQSPITPIAEQPAVAALPAGSPPLGFDGYCTVSMKRDFKWVKGNPSWGAIHRGRTYLFASQGERDEFLKTPDSYCPVLSGADPVVAVEQNMSVPGKREFAVQYPANSGQIYMFSSAENLRKFSSNAAGFAEGVRQAMAGGNGRMVR
ncbi:Thioredoxin [Posidoniimonas polymericola]|uniref:Thioredoxin n=1 Tax=Posidoniimonas polymericola TaxID=2528002 RepID=A0A5C5YFP6_9BACT|nr:thioredoxin family protein [Posidoniimonas polymericola]TWT73613.1 Thioredoxin [Posidoniimonas polymericola]